MVKKTNKEGDALRPLGDRVLVRLLEEKEKISESGIIIPESAEKDDIKKGEIVSTGPGRVGDDGKLNPVEVKKGDIVMFKEFAGDEVKIKGKNHIILSEGSILGILE